MPFDPDAAGAPGSGIFGLPHTRAEASVILTPVPFDATTSYGNGTAGGPEAIKRASMQVDLYDLVFGRIYERGIFMEEPDPAIAKGFGKESAHTALSDIRDSIEELRYYRRYMGELGGA